MKRIVKDLDFALVVKAIFSSTKTNTSVQAWSFVKYSEQHPKAVHIEVRAYQALEVTSELRKIIKSEVFQQQYKIKVYFSPQFDFKQNGRKQNNIK